MFETLVERFVIYPLVGLFWCLIFLERIYLFILTCYYRLFNVQYVIQYSKFNKYPQRIKK
jgi:hypothetical protein